MADRSDRWLVGYVALVAVLFGASVVVGHADVWLAAAIVAGPTAVVVGIWRHRPEPAKPWWLLLAGITMFAAGDVTVGLLGPFRAWSVADLWYLPAYVAIIGWLVMLSWRRVPPALIVDALVVVGSLATIVTAGVVMPFLIETGAKVGTLVVYPVMSGGFAIGAVALALTCGFRKLPAIALTLGAGAWLIADIVWLAEVSAGPTRREPC